MSNVLTEPVLVLNKNWQPVGERSVEKAIGDMLSGSGNKPPKLAMHVELELLPDGTYKLGSGTRPCTWEEWIELEIRTDHHNDRSIHSKSFTMRGPTVLICSNYADMPTHGDKWSPSAVRRRDKGICQVTGVRLAPGEGNVAHNIARDRGGKDVFQNTAYVRKDINTNMGTKTFAEAGIKLIRPMKEPPKLPAWVKMQSIKHVTWMPFIIKREKDSIDVIADLNSN